MEGSGTTTVTEKPLKSFLPMIVLLPDSLVAVKMWSRSTVTLVAPPTKGSPASLAQRPSY